MFFKQLVHEYRCTKEGGDSHVRRPTSYLQQSGMTTQESKSQSCVQSQSHVSGNAAILASNQSHQCSITSSGAELKCGCRVVVMGNLCLLNCGNLPMNQKTATGNDKFACLGKVMVSLLSLPHSNADCERTFSMVRKVHTEARKSLHADAITAFLRCKINYDCHCYDFAVTPAILRGAKTCTQEYNVEHPTKN